MKFEIEPDPAHPLGGHALLILPEGASAGSGHVNIRRSYDNRHLGPDGWQAAHTTLGPFAVSSRGSGSAVALGPEVVVHLEEFVALEIAFEGGASGSAVWPEDVLLPPDAASAGGVRRAPGTEASSEETGGVGTSPLPEIANSVTPRRGAGSPSRTSPEAPRVPETESPPAPPPEASAEPVPEPPSESRKGLRTVLIVAAIAVLAVAAALTLTDLDRLIGGMDRGDDARADCSEAAFAGDRDADPAARIERVRRCAGVEGVSPETLLAVVERLLDRHPEARVVMGRWYDPAHREADFSPFDAPSIETATRYYFAAMEAGAANADSLLLDVCARLDSNDMMQGNAHHLYCSER